MRKLTPELMRRGYGRRRYGIEWFDQPTPAGPGIFGVGWIIKDHLTGYPMGMPREDKEQVREDALRLLNQGAT